MSNLSVVSDSTKNVVQQSSPPPEEAVKETVPEPPLPPDPTPALDKSKDGSSVKSQQSTKNNGSWFGWWSRPDGYIEKPSSEDKTKSEGATKDAQTKPLPASPVEERAQPKLDQTKVNATPSQLPAIPTSEGEPKPKSVLSVGTQRSSWFWLWSSQQNAQSDERPATSGGTETPPIQRDAAATELPKDTPMPDAPLPKPSENIPVKNDAKPEAKTTQPQSPRKSTGWAFWSREESSDQSSGTTHKQVGEIAVEGTPSQNNPEAAQFNEAEEQQPAPKEPTKSKAKSVRGRPAGKDSPKQSTTPAKNTPSASPDKSKPAEPKVAALAGKPLKEQPKQAPKEDAASTKQDKNILLPDFNSTYSLLQQPSLWAQIRRLFVSDTSQHASPHLHLTPHPPRLKKALAIGIHGFFPSPIYQRIIGAPTGTSIRFSNCAASAIKSWADAHGSPDVAIEKISLEGEGTIAERIDILWKLLLNWIDHIRSADFILVACHSQGVPVAIMLVAKLIAFGCISPNMRVGVCAMAGINLGPFAEYKTRLFGGTGLELFDFAEPESRVSRQYRDAVEEVLKKGVRIVYVGSIDDQLVSLESATFAPLTHPNIYRAVFIDGRLHTNDFLTQLIGFTFKLRNLGLPDHGLIRELSPALAGSLYTGEGHSSLHNYMPIYDLAVRHALETVPSVDPAPIPIPLVGALSVNASASLTSPPTTSNPSISKNPNPKHPQQQAKHQDSHDPNAPHWAPLQGPPSVKDANPYFLPWALRGVLEEEQVKKYMGQEVEELLRLFEEWRPVSKGLKDVRFRLEVVRSKL